MAETTDGPALVIADPRAATFRGRLYRSGWLIVVLAFTSYLLIAVAEQGGVGAGLEVVPDDPLPFQGHAEVGLDLSEMSSFAALEWVESANIDNASIVVMPVDGDIVAAFNDPETFGAARTALDSLVAASGDTPVALCLHKPVSAVEESVLAEAIVTVIVEDYTDSVAYVTTCPGDVSETWNASILDVLGLEPAGGTDGRVLAPVSIGARIHVPPAIDAENLGDTYIDQLAGPTYVAVTLDDQMPLEQSLREEIGDILTNRAHVAAVLARPAPEVIPSEFVSTLPVIIESTSELAEGYNHALSPALQFEGEWTPTQVGPVVYQRTTQTGARVSAEFVGTEVWAIGLISPAAGTIGVWIDVEGPLAETEPDRIVDLSGVQAVDRAMLLIDGLPAATHQITIVASEGEVALAGLYVTGRPLGGWHTNVAALGILLTAMAGLAIVISAAIDDLRLRIGLDREQEQESDHPRIFRREL